MRGRLICVAALLVLSGCAVTFYEKNINVDVQLDIEWQNKSRSYQNTV